MKKHKFQTKIIAIFLSFIITAVALPTQAIALFLDNSETSTESLVIENDSEIEQPGVFIVEEDTSKRGQFEKHYLCSDGTYVSVTYPEAVHYLDSNQVWRDVDQSLTYDSKTESYISEKADFKVSFSNNFSSTNLASIERNGYSLSWGIQTAKKATVNEIETSSAQTNIIKIESTDLVIAPSAEISAQVTDKQEVEFNNLSDRLVSNEDSFALPNISSQISYNDIIDGSENVSVRYTVYHNKVEEDIIIAKRGDISSVSMNMDIGTLIPVVNDDGSVDLVDANNNMQFRVGIPYMMDADFNVCNDITVTAEKIGSNCIITYTPNSEWFNSDDRAFPIILDPSVTTNDYVSNIEDTYVEENSTANHTSEQYLQIYPNGTNRRRAIVRVLELPIIDEAMPIISANLKLTAQYTPFSNISLKASVGYTSFEMDEYTYADTNIIPYDYVTYATLNQGGYTVVFDCSSYIYEMYDNQQIYNTFPIDFVIGYASDTDTTNLYPFYSSEYTIPANRPVFTVRYGYTLPAGILDGGVYLFQNFASLGYMSVSSVIPANNSNVYQLQNINNELLKRQQKFKLEYVSSTGGYLLRFLGTSSGTDKLVSINRNNGDVSGGQNVYLSSTADAVSQEWLIIPVDYEKFKIVPRANMDCALTAYYYSNGSNTGTGALSAGNIFIQTYSPIDNFQHWYIYDESGNELNTSEFRSEIESGNYIISNDYTGRYLHRTGKVANCMSGTMYDLRENTITLKIVNLGDGYCTIQPTDLAHYYLAPTSSSSGSGVRFISSFSETIPDNCKWHIEVASGGGCIIQSKSTGYYLSAVSSTANPSSVCMYALNSSGTVAYQKQVWRIGPADEYIELGYAASFNDLAIDVGETKAPSVNKKPSNATWANYTDFDYTITSGSEYVSYNASTHKFTGIAPGIATVTATHKTTGITNTLTISVSILQLFKTSRRPGLGEDGEIARDMNVSDLSKLELASININLLDLANQYDSSSSSSTVLPQQGPEVLIGYMKQLPGLFATGNPNMKAVVTNMVDCFLSGTGADFSDSTLTDAVYNHQSTITFVNGTKQVLCSALNSCDGDIYSLASNTSFFSSMDNVSEPAYNTSSDYSNGLKIALNGIWGYDIDIIEFEFDGVNYSGIIRYTLFDHFGLDEGDITNSSITSEFLGYTAQFGSWFVLQRYVNCEYQYKPFVTYITFEETFSGRIS